VQVEGFTHDGADAAWQRAMRHRDLWIECELEDPRRLTDAAAH
jgi:uncharacterized protein YaeQ